MALSLSAAVPGCGSSPGWFRCSVRSFPDRPPASPLCACLSKFVAYRSRSFSFDALHLAPLLGASLLSLALALQSLSSGSTHWRGKSDALNIQRARASACAIKNSGLGYSTAYLYWCSYLSNLYCLPYKGAGGSGRRGSKPCRGAAATRTARACPRLSQNLNSLACLKLFPPLPSGGGASGGGGKAHAQKPL